MSERPSRRSLSHLLTQIEQEQKKSVSEFSTGHLNERNLYKVPLHLQHHKWETSKVPAANFKPYCKVTEKIVTEHHSEAKEALKNFSIGTVGILSHSVANKRIRRGTKAPVTVEHVGSANSQGSYSRLDDGVLVENLDASQAMIKNVSPSRPVPWADNDLSSDSYNHISMGNLKQSNLRNLKHKFVSSYLNSVTRKDQFHKMKDFEETVLARSNILERNILSGVKAVEHLELKLQQVRYCHSLKRLCIF